jgi:hypothetical protein
MAILLFLGGKFQSPPLTNGGANSGGLVYVYEPNTVNAKTTYTEPTLTTANAHPVVCDSQGRASIWFTGNADVAIKDSAGNTIYTADDVNPDTASSATGNYNLILNPSFEDDTNNDSVPDSWTNTLFTNGTFTHDTSTQSDGEKSAKFTSTGGGGGYIESTAAFEVSPLKSYEVSFALKSSVADVRNVATIYWFQSDGSTPASTASNSVFDDSATNPTSWTRKFKRVTPPANGYFAKVRFVGCDSSDATAGSTWFDGVSVTETAVTAAGDIEYIDANQAPARLAKGTAGQALVMDATASAPTWWVPRSYISGLVPSNNVADSTNDVDVTVGEATDGTNAYIMKLTSAITKRLDASWVVGTNQGGLDGSESVAGTPDTSTWYYMWLIMRVDTGVVDVLFSESASAPTMPTNYTIKRLIGAVYNGSGGDILAFNAYELGGGGLHVQWKAPPLDLDLTNAPTTVARTDTLTVPTSFSVFVNCNVLAADAGAGDIYLSCPDQTDLAASASVSPLVIMRTNVSTAMYVRIRTSATGTIRSRATAAIDTFRLATQSWEWSRR